MCKQIFCNLDILILHKRVYIFMTFLQCAFLGLMLQLAGKKRLLLGRRVGRAKKRMSAKSDSSTPSKYNLQFGKIHFTIWTNPAAQKVSYKRRVVWAAKKRAAAKSDRSTPGSLATSLCAEITQITQTNTNFKHRKSAILP